MNQNQPQIVADHVSKIFHSDTGEVKALNDINLEIKQGEFVCLLGPSGCGKSTLLNAIAGFSLQTSGSLTVNGKPVTAPGPDRGMVFQEYALFPWLTVSQNVRFGMELQKKSKAEINEKTKELLDMLKLTDFADRFPKDLSGGMRQRVAIARVLALDSQILLMDEPFGALDALTRRNLQEELLRIWEKLKKTVVFVTHGIEESIFLADRIVVMTYRPGTVKKIINIDMPRPRDTAAPEFNQIKKEISELVMEEQQRHENAQMRRRGSTAD